MTKSINSFDIDGVITVGLYPGPNDVIITGRSYEEAPETYAMLRNKGINNPVYFNPLPWDKKSRKSSGSHKAKTLINLMEAGNNIQFHFEDDEVQKAEIESVFNENGYVLPIVIHIVHDMTEKENVRHAIPEETDGLSHKVLTVFDAMNSVAKS